MYPQPQTGPPRRLVAAYQPEPLAGPPLTAAVQQMHRPTPQRPSANCIGGPIRFSAGQFAGRTIRAELQEIQKADLGRKYAKVDRRPLDPPPVIRLRLYHVLHVGTDEQQESEVKNYEEVENLGLICSVDLFQVPSPDPHGDGKGGGSRRLLHLPRRATLPAPPSYAPELHRMCVTSAQAGPSSQTMEAVPPLQSLAQPISGYLPSSNTVSEIVHRVGEYPITENSKVTQGLAGTTFVQPANVEYQGKKSLMFVFADLAVKLEGTFILRYRVFDIFSNVDGHEDLVVQAECYGQPFRVFSTKEFPGLQASTELTKQLARWGVRLNIRETERKRRPKRKRSESVCEGSDV